MDSNITNLANSTILPPRGTKVFYKDGNTEDIIHQVIEGDKIAPNDTKNFAPFLSGKDKNETCKNIWNFIKKHIEYRLDPQNEQYIKLPRLTWSDKFCDCKSYSVFAGALLRNLKIPYKYRFVSYDPADSTVTHVYIIVPISDGPVSCVDSSTSKYITIDVCMPAFDKEKPFAFKRDIMTKIYMVGCPDDGVGKIKFKKLIKRVLVPPSVQLAAKVLKNKKNRKKAGGLLKRLVVPPHMQLMQKAFKKRKGLLKARKNRAIGQLELGPDPSAISEGEMTLLIAQQNREIAKMNHEALRGIGSIGAENIQNQIDILEDAINALHDPEELDFIAEDVANGEYSVYGIGDIGRSKKRAERKAKRKQKRAEKKKVRGGKTKFGKFLKKAANTVKKGVKAVTKLSTLPARLGIKLVLEVMLPKAAPFFMYLFINDPKTLEKLPPKVKKKRKKAEKVADFIVNVVGMKRNHFMGIVRNGIMKQYKMSPEAYLNKSMSGKLSGIGIAPLVAAVPMVMKLLQKLFALFKKKGEGVSEADAPDPESDFAGMDSGDKASLASDIKRNSIVDSGGGGGSESDSSVPDSYGSKSSGGSSESSSDPDPDNAQNLASGGRKGSLC